MVTNNRGVRGAPPRSSFRQVRAHPNDTNPSATNIPPISVIQPGSALARNLRFVHPTQSGGRTIDIGTFWAVARTRCAGLASVVR